MKYATILLLMVMVGCGGGGKPSPLVVSTQQLNAASVGQSYTSKLEAIGGKPPYTWTALGLPKGLTLSPDGTLYGTPQESGKFAVAFQVCDADSVCSRN